MPTKLYICYKFITYLHGSLFPKYFDLSHYTAPHFKRALQGSSEARSLSE